MDLKPPVLFSQVGVVIVALSCFPTQSTIIESEWEQLRAGIRNMQTFSLDHIMDCRYVGNSGDFIYLKIK